MDPFDILGLAPRFDLDLLELEQRYRDLQKALHPDRHVRGTASERRASLSHAVTVNEAYRVLKDDLARAQALLLRFGGAAADQPGADDTTLLMEVMALREALSEARTARDGERALTLATQVRALAQAATDALGASLAGCSVAPPPGLLAEAARELVRLRYYRRFQTEVEALKDEILE